MSNVTSMNCTYTCKTYNGSILIGTTTVTSNISISYSIGAPIVSGTVIDSNSTTIALTGNSNKLIKYFSNAQCTISATARMGASITEKSINNVVVTENTATINNVENNVCSFMATDSRDFKSYYLFISSMIDYIKLTNNATAVRVTPTGNTVNLKLSGNYFNNSFGATNNTLTCKYRKRVSGGSWGSYTTVTATKNGNTYNYSATISGFTYTQNYEVEVVVTDKLMNVSKSIIVNAGTPIFDWGANDFNFNVPVNFNSNISFNGVNGSVGNVLTVGSNGNPTWGNTTSFLKATCSSASNHPINTSTSWANVEIPFNTVAFNVGEGLTLDSSNKHSIDCSKSGYLEITGSAYFKIGASSGDYVSLHIISGNNTEIASVKNTAIEGSVSIGPFIVPYSTSNKSFTLCARSSASNASIVLNNRDTWLQVKYIT